jgi:uncharacterized membrane-anchored protein
MDASDESGTDPQGLIGTPAEATAGGTARVDRKTKHLLERLAPGEIAVISHADIDEVSARALAAKRPAMIINAEPCITGRYRCPGPAILMDAGIPVLDCVGDQLMDSIADGAEVQVCEERVSAGGRVVGSGRRFGREHLVDAYAAADANRGAELERFVTNTLQYALQEKDIILGELDVPSIKTRVRGRHCVIAVRGSNYLEDLAAVGSYIREVRPVLIGVDGGADALIDADMVPDMIIGDMDSVTDKALFSGAELIAHAYPDGRSPASDRLTRLGLAHSVFRCPGTSEDIAMLLAHHKGASLIVMLGSHSNMLDFLEKGRPGMGSTFLVRLKVGSVLVDARGVSQLYRGRLRLGHVASIVAAAAVPLIALAMASRPLAGLARLIILRLRVALGLM